MMNGNTSTDFRNLALVRKAGVTALKKELGTVRAAYAMRRLYSSKQIDYAAERDKMISGVTHGEVERNFW